MSKKSDTERAMQDVSFFTLLIAVIALAFVFVYDFLRNGRLPSTILLVSFAISLISLIALWNRKPPTSVNRNRSLRTPLPTWREPTLRMTSLRLVTRDLYYPPRFARWAYPRLRLAPVARKRSRR